MSFKISLQQVGAFMYPLQPYLALFEASRSATNMYQAALERNELLRATWLAEYGDIPADYFVWLDESSIDDRLDWQLSGVLVCAVLHSSKVNVIQSSQLSLRVVSLL